MNVAVVVVVVVIVIGEGTVLGVNVGHPNVTNGDIVAYSSARATRSSQITLGGLISFIIKNHVSTISVIKERNGHSNVIILLS